jgi:7-cyano-7-deazaguanine synthase
MAGDCVLLSGGIDSALVLHRVASDAGDPVHPLYVRFGFRWEEAELTHAERLLAGYDPDGVELPGIAVLDVPVDDVYDDHWAIDGHVPDADTDDAAVELPGRNVLILGKAGLYADAEGCGAIWHGTLGRNPFPDATQAFFGAMADALSRGFDRELTVRAPLADATKTAAIRELADTEIDLGTTFSCIDPVGGRHCGRCNKCAERREGFERAGVADPTEYDAGPTAE